jgi:hypothetical protein
LENKKISTKSSEAKCHFKWHANWQKNSSKVRDKWQRKIHAKFGIPLFYVTKLRAKWQYRVSRVIHEEFYVNFNEP